MTLSAFLVTPLCLGLVLLGSCDVNAVEASAANDKSLVQTDNPNRRESAGLGASAEVELYPENPCERECYKRLDRCNSTCAVAVPPRDCDDICWPQFEVCMDKCRWNINVAPTSARVPATDNFGYGCEHFEGHGCRDGADLPCQFSDGSVGICQCQIPAKRWSCFREPP